MTTDPKELAEASSVSSLSEDINPEGAGAVTFINAFEVPVEQSDTFIAHWRELAKIMSTAPGFRGLRLHRALSSQTRFQIINVANWESPQAWKAPRRIRSFKMACVLWPRTPKCSSVRTRPKRGCYASS